MADLTGFQSNFMNQFGALPSDLFPGLNLEPFAVQYDMGSSLSSLFPSLLNLALGQLPGVGGAPQQIPGVPIGQNPLLQLSINARACPPKLIGGKMKAQHLSVPTKGHPSHCVTNRHMNSLNPHALRRATRRIASFHSFAVKAEKEMAKAFRKGGFHVPSSHRRTTRCTTCRKTNCSCG